jgi:hypothetical protein
MDGRNNGSGGSSNTADPPSPQSPSLDLFLASIESKLRGPFSSVDLSKTVKTPALRGSDVSERGYLRRIASVLDRTDKITQCRILIALLGLLEDPVSAAAAAAEDDDHDDDEDNEGDGGMDIQIGASPSSSSSTRIDRDILRVLEQVQEGSASATYDEWVRVVAGLVQGIAFRDGNLEEDREGDGGDGDNLRRDMVGPQARKVMDKTASDIVKRVQSLVRSTEYEEDDPNFVLLDKSDADPTFLAPYRYSLLHPSLLRRVIPELFPTSLDAASSSPPLWTSPHFVLNDKAEILHFDANLERIKLDEEKEHKVNKQQGGGGGSSTAGGGPLQPRPQSSSTGAVAVLSAGKQSDRDVRGISGSIPNSKQQQKQASRPKSSMFLPSKRPPGLTGGGGGAGGKSVLHARKAGAAQALLVKGRGGRVLTGGPNTSAVAGRSAPTGAGGEGGASSSTSRATATATAASQGGVPSHPGNNAGRSLVKGRAAALMRQQPQHQQPKHPHPHYRAAAGAAKSKMVMMDVSEVANLNQQREQQQQQNQHSSTTATAAGKRKAAQVTSAAGHSTRDEDLSHPTQHRPNKVAKKQTQSSSTLAPAADRNLPVTDDVSTSAAAATTDKSACATSRTAMTPAAVPAAAAAALPPTASAGAANSSDNTGALASAALSTYQAQLLAQRQQQQSQQQGAEANMDRRPSVGGGSGGGGGGLDWKDMLRQRSNRLSDDDRHRIQLFFLQRSNPTPNDGETVHRIKLHEERASDPFTGLPIKETYYLELDYGNYTSRQSKKIKRYKEGQ